MERSARQTTFQAKATAAAKLVLQDMDPAAKKKRQHFSSGPPQGILALHVKTLRNFSKTFFFTSTFANCTEIRLYLKIAIQGSVKCSKIVHVKKDAAVPKAKLVLGKQNKMWSKKSVSPNDSKMRHALQRGGSTGHRDSLAGGHAEITIDELKTFSLELCRNRDDMRNKILLELIEIENPGTRARATLNVGFATLHLFDLIREMYGTKSIPLMVKDKRIADLEYEFVFRYGTFGYGYSHEFEQNETPISDIMKESMFFKLDPPLNRLDDDGLLAPTQVSAPKSISEGLDVEESENMRKKAVSSSVDMFFPIDISNIEQLLEKRNRLAKMKAEYSRLKTRHDRNRYLENLVAKSGSSGADGTGEGEEGEDNQDKGGPRALIGVHVDSQRQVEAVKAVIGNLSPLLLMAPGLQSRGSQPRGRPAATQSRSSDDDRAMVDPMERLRQLYEKHKGPTESEEKPERGTSGSPSSPKTQDKRGFMGVLKRKVLAPMRFNKLLGGLKGQVSDPEEGQSGTDEEAEASPRSSNLSDLLGQINRVRPSEEPSTTEPAPPRRSFPWRRALSRPTTDSVTTESENSTPRSNSSFSEKEDEDT